MFRAIGICGVFLLEKTMETAMTTKDSDWKWKVELKRRRQEITGVIKTA